VVDGKYYDGQRHLRKHLARLHQPNSSLLQASRGLSRFVNNRKR